MRKLTQLEKELEQDIGYLMLRGMLASPVAVQKRLDEIATEVCAKVGPDALVEHMRVVYDETAEQYAKNPEHEAISDALLVFMSYLKDKDCVVDVGCGTGRDTIFMALPPGDVRAKFMTRTKNGKTTLERLGMPSVRLFPQGLDVSLRMVRIAWERARQYGLWDQNTHCDVSFHGSIDMNASNDLHPFADGIWSSAALFMHTPRERIESAIEGVMRMLKPGGIFGVTYANNKVGAPYDNLRFSRTGEIKYFSRPKPAEITEAAKKAGLVLLREDYSDLEVGDATKKDFFVAQFFNKQQ